METQICNVCGKELPLDDFQYRSDNKKYRPVCKSCRAKQEAARRYSITVEEVEEMLVKQDYRCAICGIHQDDIQHNTFKYSPLVIDHDHNTGKVRGLLCPSCNLILGNALDNPDTLIKAALYLTREE